MNAAALVFEPALLTQYELATKVGDPDSPDGQTEVVVRGDGSFQAMQRGAHEKGAETHAKLQTPQVEMVMRSATQFDWAASFPPRPGIPDEPIVDFSLRAPHGRVVTTRMWLRDVEKGAMTGEVLTVLRQALERASDGRMFL